MADNNNLASLKPARPEISAGLAVVRRNEHGQPEVLFIARKERREDGKLPCELPKGHVEGEETLHEAAIRELTEESGAHGVVVGEQIAVCKYMVRARGTGAPPGQEPKVEKTTTFFVATPTPDISIVDTDREESTRVVLWLTLEEINGSKFVALKGHGDNAKTAVDKTFPPATA